eukprot:357225-Chlamydomonas_euryale.AAC.3
MHAAVTTRAPHAAVATRTPHADVAARTPHADVATRTPRTDLLTQWADLEPTQTARTSRQRLGRGRWRGKPHGRNLGCGSMWLGRVRHESHSAGLCGFV